MKYLKRFNESENTDLEEMKLDTEDILIDYFHNYFSNDNLKWEIKEDVDLDSFSVKINIDNRKSDDDFITREQLSNIKKTFDRIIRQYSNNPKSRKRNWWYFSTYTWSYDSDYIPSDLVKVEYDSDKWEIVFNNLLTNEEYNVDGDDIEWDEKTLIYGIEIIFRL